jgi:glycosyltransferase involved in cell wall biosynthesis
MNRLTQGITVIIAAYRAEEFIEECLDSILKQQWDFRMIEVLVGVDGCEATLNKIMEIKDKYNDIRLKCIWFKENMGCYITSNTLISMAKFNNILTFGADDIMLPHMIKTIMSYSDRYNMIKFKMLNFQHTNPNINHVYRIAAEGCRFFDKRVFMLVGGYVPWRHTGDSEYIARTKPVTCECYIEEVLFHRRLHEKALTITPKTCIGSEERNEKKKLIYDNYERGIIQIPLTINKNFKIMFDLKEYWDKRYKTGGNSGAGSYGEEAKVKADYINNFIKNYKIETIQEYGCGDGANMALYKGYKQYTGYDIAPTSIELCKTNPDINQSNCRFTYNQTQINGNADLALCLDVLLHQVEDKDYWQLMDLIFKRGNHQYVLLYSPSKPADSKSAVHVRYRQIIEDVARMYQDYRLQSVLPVNITEEKYFLLYKL